VSPQEIEKWLAYYREAVERDFAQMIYKQCAKEDADEAEAEGS
jgi:hypothetical protein